MIEPNNMYAPVVIFTYNRLNHLKQTVEALKANYLAEDTVLYIYSDAASNDRAVEEINAVRDYISGITGFKSVEKMFRDHNYGGLKNIMEGQSEVVNRHGKAIIMEDDNITSRNFLIFMNQGLDFYANDPDVYSVCGYCPPIVSGIESDFDVWHYPWNISWGYGFWKSKYDKFHPLKNRFPEMRRSGLLRKIIGMGGLYIVDSLRRDFNNQATFPDAILCADMTNAGMYSILPCVSKVKNIGSDGSGTSKGVLTDKYDVDLDDGSQLEFRFVCDPAMDLRYTKLVQSFYNGRLVTRIARHLAVYHLWIKLKSWLMSLK